MICNANDLKLNDYAKLLQDKTHGCISFNQNFNLKTNSFSTQTPTFTDFWEDKMMCPRSTVMIRSANLDSCEQRWRLRERGKEKTSVTHLTLTGLLTERI